MTSPAAYRIEPALQAVLDQGTPWPVRALVKFRPQHMAYAVFEPSNLPGNPRHACFAEEVSQLLANCEQDGEPLKAIAHAANIGVATVFGAPKALRRLLDQTSLVEGATLSSPH